MRPTWRAPGPQVLRRAGLSVHSNLDLDIEVPDADLEAGLPSLLAAALALGVWQLKAAVDGPPEFNPPKGSLQGRTVLITGASSGLGFESAVRLAEAGARVVATARAEKVSGVEQALQDEVPQADVAVLPLDLADLNSIETFASQLDVRGIDVVVCNAGVMAVPERSETKDGFELQLGVNHLGHFALCGRLLPLLGASAESPCRVVCVSSLAHRLGDMQRLLAGARVV
ncbi:unnamed protein product [Effrenium voratum]|nr:unnamed protein product [Effrenium voratum]